MAPFLLILLAPVVCAAAAFLVTRAPARRAVLLAGAVGNAAGVAWAWLVRPQLAFDGWIGLDSAGLVFLSITSGLFLVAAVYGVGYLQREARVRHVELEAGYRFYNAPEAIFIGCLLLFLSAMSLVTVSQHFGLLWVAVEATTLSSAPLIYFHRHHRSLEAAWKYLIISSVGIALALLGNIFLAIAASRPEGGHQVLLTVDGLIATAQSLDVAWLRAAFVLFLVGYGTKMGLAPMHTWLPDAHSEAPSLVSALLSGALLNTAFLAILRVFQVASAAGEGPFASGLLVVLGLTSMAVAAVFILRQPDFKRLLAYSSVEHMGILALGVGLGGEATFGALLHAVNHSLAKAMLFLAAGNILAAYRSKASRDVRGLLKDMPVSGALWLAGALAIVGSPPFGTFISELIILRGAIDAGRWIIAGMYVALLALVFMGVISTALQMTQGRSQRPEFASAREPALAVVPPAVLGVGVLALGLYLPAALEEVLRGAARALGGGL